MKQLILICPLILLLLSCDKVKEDTPPRIGNYAAQYMVHMNHGLHYTTFKGYSLEYDNSQVARRTGSAACILSNSCQNEPAIIDDLAYGDNSIRITDRSNNEMSIMEGEWVFGMKNPDQPAYLLIKEKNQKTYDSLAYTYSSSGKISQIVTYSVYRDASEVTASKKFIKKFFFNSQDNLEKVETRQLLVEGFVLTLTIEEFDDYDASINPFKGLFMFGDTYYRSLSKNNFREYRKEEIDMQYKISVAKQSANWALTYDQANRPLFDKL